MFSLISLISNLVYSIAGINYDLIMLFLFNKNKKPSSKSNLKSNDSTLANSNNKKLAFISLSLGFLVIWTAVIAGVLVSNTVSDNFAAKETVKIFKTHEDIAKLTFAIGHEMGM